MDAKASRRWPLNGFMEFPGGKIEAGEDSIAAAARELKEEVSIAKAAPCLRLLKFITMNTVIER